MIFEVNDRVFQDGHKIFSTVTRKNILGITNAVVIAKDNGKLEAVTAPCGVDCLIDTETGKDGHDVQYTIPVDVKNVGPSVLTAQGVELKDQTALFQKFMNLPDENRVTKGQDWLESVQNSDPTFVPQFISSLENDNTIIQNSIINKISILDQDTKDSLFQKLLTSTTEEERVNIIVEFTSTKNLKKGHEIFMQNSIYSFLMDDDLYLTFEMKRFGKYIYDETTLSNKIETFFANKTAEEKTEIINQWKGHKYFLTKRFASLFVKNILE